MQGTAVVSRDQALCPQLEAEAFSACRSGAAIKPVLQMQKE
jgi:hypothetical protein